MRARARPWLAAAVRIPFGGSCALFPSRQRARRSLGCSAGRGLVFCAYCHHIHLHMLCQHVYGVVERGRHSDVWALSTEDTGCIIMGHGGGDPADTGRYTYRDRQNLARSPSESHDMETGEGGVRQKFKLQDTYGVLRTASKLVLRPPRLHYAVDHTFRRHDR